MASFPGGPGVMPASMNPTAGMSDQEAQMVKAMQMGMESCLGKTVMAGVMGGGLGAMFGLFMSSMRYDSPMSQPLPISTPTPATATATAVKPTTTSTIPTSSTLAASKPTIPTPAVQPTPSTLSPTAAPAITLTPTGSGAAIPISDLPLKQQLKHGLRDMYRSSLSSGRNFAKVGAIFSGTECAIEGLRAKNDLWNGVMGGCLTGGILARNAGPQAAAVGCFGFGAFSLAIDSYMRMPDDEKSRPIA